MSQSTDLGNVRGSSGIEVVGRPREDDTLVLCSLREWRRWIDIAADEQGNAERWERSFRAERERVARMEEALRTIAGASSGADVPEATIPASFLVNINNVARRGLAVSRVVRQGEGE